MMNETRKRGKREAKEGNEKEGKERGKGMVEESDLDQEVSRGTSRQERRVKGHERNAG